MTAYRCPLCLINWPHTSEFQPCPECNTPTETFTNSDPIDMKEALSRKRHADFGRYCAQRDAAGDPLEALVKIGDN